MARLTVLLLGLAAVAHAASLRASSDDASGSGSLDIGAAAQSASDNAEAVAEQASQSIEETAAREDEVKQAVEKLQGVVEADKEADANEKELDKAMDAALKHSIGESTAESKARQAVFDAQHATYAAVVNKLVQELDSVLDGHESRLDAAKEMREQQEEGRKDKDRMYLRLQSECALRVQHALNDLYEASDAVQYGAHMGRKASHEQRLAFDKAIRAAKASISPKIGFDLNAEIAKAVEAARDTWAAAAGVNAFDQSLAPARARAEHFLSLAREQQRQCAMLTLGDVEDILEHKRNVLAVLGDGALDAADEAVLEGAQAADAEQPEHKAVFGGAGRRAAKAAKHPRLPHDPCVWSISPRMSDAAVAHHIVACRQAREADVYAHGSPYGTGYGYYDLLAAGGYADPAAYGAAYGAGYGAYPSYGYGAGYGAGYGSAYGAYGHHAAHHAAHHAYPHAAMAAQGFDPAAAYAYGGGSPYDAASATAYYNAFGAGYPAYAGATPSGAFANAYAGMYGGLPSAMQFGQAGQYFPWNPVPQPGPSSADAAKLAQGAQAPPAEAADKAEGAANNADADAKPAAEEAKPAEGQ